MGICLTKKGVDGVQTRIYKTPSKIFFVRAFFSIRNSFMEILYN